MMSIAMNANSPMQRSPIMRTDMWTDLVLAAAAVLAVGLGTWVHAQFYKRVPLFSLAPKAFVLETIQWLPSAEQETLLMNAQLGITRRQWRQIQARVNILIDKQLGIHKEMPTAMER
jgi:hypothetical protein